MILLRVLLLWTAEQKAFELDKERPWAIEPALLWPNCRDVVDGTLTTATRRAGESAGPPPRPLL